MALRGKKELNNELQLTSFIDLLSTLVCFLLVSAVWVQIASMDLAQTHGTGSQAAREAAELDVDLKGPSEAKLVLKRGGKTLNTLTVKEADHKQLVSKLNAAVIGFKNLPALKGGAIASVLVGPHVTVTHGEMIDVLDGLRLQGFTNLGIKPEGGK